MSKEGQSRSEGLQNIGKYRILGTLGRGSMGIVYRALDPEIGRTVAIKTLRKIVASGGKSAKENLDRFKAEARSAGNLRHPNIITIFEANSYDDTPYLVMDYIEGQTLDALIHHAGRLEPSITIKLLSKVAQGLDYAHGQGILHRDIKPANILIDKNQNSFILDFGVAKILGDPAFSGGPVLGTPGYMAPEQILNQDLDQRVDLFALAVVAFECLTGKRPFEGDTFNEVIGNILNGVRRSAHEIVPSLPPAIEQTFARALSRERNERYPTAIELIDALASASGTGDISASGAALPVPRRRKDSEWKPFKNSPTADTPPSVDAPPKATPVPRPRMNSAEFLSPWRIGMRTPAIHKRRVAGELAKPGDMFASGANHISMTRQPRRAGKFTSRATMILGVFCGILVLAIFIVLLDTTPPPPRQGSPLDPVAPKGPVSEPPAIVPLRPDEVAPPDRGASIHAMTDAQVLGVIVSPSESEESIIDALREGLSRRISKLPEAALFSLQNSSYLVRAETLKILGAFGDNRVVPHVLPMLDDYDPTVRTAAAECIGALGDRRSTGYISNRLLSETNPTVRSALQRAMNRINGLGSRGDAR